MGRLLRKVIAAVAAYAIVMQALLTGVALAAHAAPDPFSVICSSQNSGGHPDAPARHDADCGLCILSCENVSAVVPAVFDNIIDTRDIAVVEHAVAWLTAPPAYARHEPHASRAPPTS